MGVHRTCGEPGELKENTHRSLPRGRHLKVLTQHKAEQIVIPTSSARPVCTHLKVSADVVLTWC